jgi:hypothetical protein
MRYVQAIPSLGWLSGLILVLGLLIGGCSDNPAALAPFQPEVSNVADSFSLQATGVTSVSTTATYTWSNSGTRATINHSTTTAAGSAVLVIKDGAGATVYNKALVPSLNEPTEAGVAGSWTIEVRLTSYSGTLNVLAQKL